MKFIEYHPEKMNRYKSKNPLLGHFSSHGKKIVLWTTTISYNASKKDGGGFKSLEGVTARVETGAELQARVTMTRLALLGVFAFAAKKQSGGEKFLIVEGNEFLWAMEVDQTMANKAMMFAAKINNAAKALSPEQFPKEPLTPWSGADELTKYKKLFDDGVINESEYSAKKAQILNL